MTTIRELFHSLGNKHNLITVGCGVSKEMLGRCLKNEVLSEKLKEELFYILKNLDRHIEDALEAEKIAIELHDKIYKIMDPDIGKPL